MALSKIRTSFVILKICAYLDDTIEYAHRYKGSNNQTKKIENLAKYNTNSYGQMFAVFERPNGKSSLNEKNLKYRCRHFKFHKENNKI